MAEVLLRYVVPVWATVDTETEEVTRVEVGDEDIKYDGANITQDEIEARQIADEADWPAWTFG